MKTSISLNPQLSEAIDNYRRDQPRIPSISRAIRDLLWNALLSKDIPREEITEIPKGVLFENKTVSVEKSRGRFMIRFNPTDLNKIMEKGFISEEGLTKVDVTLRKASEP